MIKILAIDDSNIDLDSLNIILKNVFSDVIVLTARNGQKGIDLARSENPDVILLDIVMPGMDGFEVCTRLKKEERVQDIPVIFLTDLKDDKESRIKALEIGAEGFLSKPIDETELIAQVRAMVKIKAANGQKHIERLNLKRLVDERTSELEKSHEMFLKLTDQIPGVVYQYRMYSDGRSCFPYSSPGMKDIYGVTPEEVREDATPAFGRLHPEDYDYIVSSVMDSARTLELYHSEFRVILPDIGVRWRLCDAKPERMEDGGTLWYGIITDITDMRKSRQELIAAKEMAEESNRLKSAFLNNMSHEIRTPMNHIMGFSSLMAEAHGEEKDGYAEIILNSSNQLLTLIENVILLSRLQSEKPEVNQQPLEPNDIVNNLGDRIRPECLKKNIALKLKIPKDNPHLSILSDHEKIKRILINLTSNAIKYTAEGFVEVGYEIKQDNLIFYVKDTGMGIPTHEQDKIFDSFYRTDLVISKAIGGTGLGLSIVKELVRSMSGKYWLESEVGNGSCFYFSIPMVRSKEALEIEKPAPSPHQKMKDLSILIADDEQINFLYLEILLKNSVKRIDHAYNGKEALEMVSKQSYNMIFMDLKMPEMSGYDAAMKIKQSYPAIPIIAQTAYASIEDREKALQAGFDDFIAKPIKKNALFELIQKYS